MKVGLFIPCLVDQFYPEIGESVLEILDRLGLDVHYPESQTCCGLPFYNMGSWEAARRPARHFLDVFEPYDAVVTPSSSCAAMVKRFFPHLFRDVPELSSKIRSLGERTHELTAFLVNELEKSDLGASFSGSVACHRSCHLRELEAGQEAETLIRKVSGATLVALPRGEVCCGFGGAFSVKFPVLSGALGQAKCETFDECQADAVVTTDAGCMMQINGILHRQGSGRRVRHIAELLAGKIRNDG
ncbi:(Fe-S)-binding protein [Candidatus Sumerlaeota bacterium]|nr:(Fe-S)-binding protein [Candidatus Sumerlaeota bacterium]